MPTHNQPSDTPRTPADLTEHGRTLYAALEAAGGVDRVTIDVTPAGFAWRLSKGGREFFVADGDARQVASMLVATEGLLNTELGIAEPQLCRPALN